MKDFEAEFNKVLGQDDTQIIFMTTVEGRKKMTFSRLIEFPVNDSEAALEEDFEIDVEPPTELVITRDIINNIVDVDMKGLGDPDGCLIVK